MAGAAVIATQLTDRAVREYGLYLGGVDVLPFVDFESITITEAYPGSVSSMAFTMRDPSGTAPMPAAGNEVVFQDITLDARAFAGHVGDYSATPMAGGTGRTITVNAVGLEATLDWYVQPATNLDGSDLNPKKLTERMAWLASTITPQSALTAPAPADGDPFDGSASRPIGSFYNGTNVPEVFAADGPYITSAGPLRAALEYAAKVAWRGAVPGPRPPVDLLITVDFYRRLRVFTFGAKPSDYTDLTISDTIGGARASTSLSYDVHPTDVVRAVYVAGANAAGSGWVGDGSGIPGKQAAIDAPNSSDADGLANVGAAYLASQSILVRGRLTIENYSPSVATIHPGSSVVITDANVGLSAQSYVIAGITKTFHSSGTQNWVVDFGGRRPNFIESVRREYGAPNTYLTGRRT